MEEKKNFRHRNSPYLKVIPGVPDIVVAQI